MKAIAEMAGVSRQAVSSVINGRWKEIRLSEKTYLKIQKVLRETQFNPNSLGRALVLQRSQLIGVIAGEVNYSFFPAALQGAEDLAEEKGYGLVVMTTRDSAERQEQVIRFLLDRSVDGLLLHSFSEISPDLQARIQAKNVPVVYMGRDGTSFCSNSRYAGTDGQQVGAIGIRHLIERGHRNIVCVDLMDPVREGVQAVLDEKSSDIHVEFWRDMSYREAWQRWSGSSNRATAIFFMGDDIACKFMNLAIPSGVRIPEELAVLGVDDIPAAAEAIIPLSTVRQPKYELGQAATQILFTLLDNKKAKDVVFTPSLVARKTT